ncbi:hypothetical protein Neosp_011362 [[Neocosmospora] mangrovei]
MAKSEEEGSMNLDKADPSLALLDLLREHTSQRAKRAADPTPATTPPPAKRANTRDTFELHVPGLRNVVRDLVREELRKQLPDLLASDLSDLLPDVSSNNLSDLPDVSSNNLSDLLPKVLGDQATKSDGLQKTEEVRLLRDEISQPREKMEKNEAAQKKLVDKHKKLADQHKKLTDKHKELADNFEQFREPATKVVRDLRMRDLGKAKTTKAASSKEG